MPTLSYTSAPEPPYDRYLDRNEFRLMRLCPGDWKAPLQCELFIGRLEKAPKYQALSYAWGSQSVTRPILVDNVEMEITVNLETALRYLRREDVKVVLWVDALCINQKDFRERQAQVEIMRNIYALASSVVVFLGEGRSCPSSTYPWSTKPQEFVFFGDERDSEHIDRLISNCESKSVARLSANFAVYSLIAMLAQQDGQHAHILSTLEEEVLCSLFEDLRIMLRSSWWSRIWVFQEIIVSQYPFVQYGQCITTWAVLTRATRNIKGGIYSNKLPPDCVKVLEFFSRCISDIEDHRSRWASLKTSKCINAGVELLDLLQVTGARKATDDRDRVYALLGLLPDGLDIKPDYHMETSEVWTQVARNVIRATGSLDTLAGYMGQKNNRGDLPSWVPDWSALAYGEEIRRSKIATQLYNACASSRITCWTTPESFWMSVCKDILRRAPPSEQEVLGEDLSIKLWSLDLVRLPQRITTQGKAFITEKNIFAPKWNGKLEDLGAHHPCTPQLDRLWTPATYVGTIKLSGDQLPSVADGNIPSSSHTEWRNLFTPADSCVPQSDVGAGSQWESKFSQALPDATVLEALVCDLKYVSGQFERLNDSDKIHLQHWWTARTSPISQGYQDVLGFDFVLGFMSSRRRLFMTHEGYFGWGPGDLVPGDHIFILPGGKTPYILRSDNTQFDPQEILTSRMIGSCYLQGAMDGQYAGILPSYCKEPQVLNGHYLNQLWNIGMHCQDMWPCYCYNIGRHQPSKPFGMRSKARFSTEDETAAMDSWLRIWKEGKTYNERDMDDRRNLPLQELHILALRRDPLPIEKRVEVFVELMQMLDVPERNFFTASSQSRNQYSQQSYIVCLE